MGRLWKNIIFPGIYSDYADTKEPLKTVKVETTQSKKPISRNDIDSFQSQNPKEGTYNVVDEKSVPTYKDMTQIGLKTLKPVINLSISYF